jgi:hypothetical protein
MRYQPGPKFPESSLIEDRDITDYLMVGDILMTIGFGGGAQEHAQRFSKMFGGKDLSQGFEGAGHATMYLGRGVVTEAVDKGVRRVYIYKYLGNFGGSRVNVYRCKDREWAKNAALLGKQWSGGLTKTVKGYRKGLWGDAKYSSKSAIFSPFSSYAWGKRARLRAIKYAARRKLGSPVGKEGLYCSMYVVCCYQGAALIDYVNPIPTSDHKAINNFGYSHAQKYWNGPVRYTKFDYKTQFGEGLYIDSKNATPMLLTAKLGKDTDHWKYKGFFFHSARFDCLDSVLREWEQKQMAQKLWLLPADCELSKPKPTGKKKKKKPVKVDFNANDLKAYAEVGIWFNVTDYTDEYQDMWDNVIKKTMHGKVRPVQEVEKWRILMAYNLQGMNLTLT